MSLTVIYHHLPFFCDHFYDHFVQVALFRLHVSLDDPTAFIMMEGSVKRAGTAKGVDNHWQSHRIVELLDEVFDQPLCPLANQIVMKQYDMKMFVETGWLGVI